MKANSFDVDGNDERQLLELIESADAEAFEAGIAAMRDHDPDQARRIDAMRRDRALLQSLPPIDPPVDFLAELEPQIARPMLMDELTTIGVQPGAARRAAHHRRVRGQLLQAAVAASVALVVFVGAWISASSLGLFDRAETSVAESTTDGVGQPIASTDLADGVAADGQSNNLSSANALAASELHHRAPSLSDIQQFIAPPMTAMVDDSTSGSPQPVPSRTGAAANTGELSPSFILAEFALVLQASDAAAVQSQLGGAIASVETSSAVVKNLTVDELGLIEQAWLARRAASGNPVGPMHAAVGNTSPAGNTSGIAPPRRVEQLNVEMLQESVKQLIEQVLVAGSSELMPSYNRQIELSQAGLQYTLAVPVSELNAVLARLNTMDAGSGALVLRESINVQTNAVAPMAWATDRDDIMATLDRLVREQPEAVLLLPVVLPVAQ